jgi:hypothetical protein
MQRTRFLSFLGLTAAIFAGRAAAETAPHLATAIDVLFRDDFSRAELGAAWKTNDAAKKAPGQSRIVDGALVTTMAAHSDHGATVNTPVQFADAVITCRFRLLDNKGFNLPLNDASEKSVHAGHICRLRIAPGRVQLQDDKTGQMNLEVQELRKDPAKAKEVAARMAGTSVSFNAPIEVGRWHALRLELVGDEMLVQVDGKNVGYLKSPGFAHPTKRSFGFTVASAPGVAFDDVMLSGARRVPEWSAERAAVTAKLQPIAAKKGN